MSVENNPLTAPEVEALCVPQLQARYAQGLQAWTARVETGPTGYSAAELRVWGTYFGELAEFADTYTDIARQCAAAGYPALLDLIASVQNDAVGAATVLLEIRPADAYDPVVADAWRDAHEFTVRIQGEVLARKARTYGIVNQMTQRQLRNECLVCGVALGPTGRHPVCQSTAEYFVWPPTS